MQPELMINPRNPISWPITIRMLEKLGLVKKVRLAKLPRGSNTPERLAIME